ncbi:MAG: hypothetical protein IPI27_14270 [Betaproteobacteria bacterium]|nr:hypothetical protein [Betaproteobacteria bacterium]
MAQIAGIPPPMPPAPIMTVREGLGIGLVAGDVDVVEMEPAQRLGPSARSRAASSMGEGSCRRQ